MWTFEAFGFLTNLKASVFSNQFSIPGIKIFHVFACLKWFIFSVCIPTHHSCTKMQRTDELTVFDRKAIATWA